MKLNEFEKSASLAFRTAYIICMMAILNACAPVSASTPKDGFLRPPSPSREPSNLNTTLPQVFEVEVCEDISGNRECDPDEPTIGNVYADILALSADGSITTETVYIDSDGFGTGNLGEKAIDILGVRMRSIEGVELDSCFSGNYDVITDRTRDGKDLEKTLIDLFPVLCPPRIG